MMSDMTARKSASDEIPIQVAQLTLTVQTLTTILQRHSDVLDGTNKSQGMKEKIAIAEYNLELNKQAYKNVMEEVKAVEERLNIRMTQDNLNLKNDIFKRLDEFKTSLTTLQNDNKEQDTLIKKLQPWVNGIAWFLVTAGVVLIGMILRGELHLTFK